MENLKPTINEKDEWDISEIDSTPKTWGELYKEQHADKTETEKPKLSDEERNLIIDLCTTYKFNVTPEDLFDENFLYAVADVADDFEQLQTHSPLKNDVRQKLLVWQYNQTLKDPVGMPPNYSLGLIVANNRLEEKASQKHKQSQGVTRQQIEEAARKITSSYGERAKQDHNKLYNDYKSVLKAVDDEHDRLDRELNKAAELVESAPTPRPAKEETAKNLGKKASLFSFFKPPKK